MTNGIVVKLTPKQQTEVAMKNMALRAEVKRLRKLITEAYVSASETEFHNWSDAEVDENQRASWRHVAHVWLAAQSTTDPADQHGANPADPTVSL